MKYLIKTFLALLVLGSGVSGSYADAGYDYDYTKMYEALNEIYEKRLHSTWLTRIGNGCGAAACKDKIGKGSTEYSRLEPLGCIMVGSDPKNRHRSIRSNPKCAQEILRIALAQVQKLEYSNFSEEQARATEVACAVAMLREPKIFVGKQVFSIKPIEPNYLTPRLDMRAVTIQSWGLGGDTRQNNLRALDAITATVRAKFDKNSQGFEQYKKEALQVYEELKKVAPLG